MRNGDAGLGRLSRRATCVKNSRRWVEIDSPIKNSSAYKDADGEGFFVITSIDNGAFHMSISKNDRYPTLDEIVEARNYLCPLYMTMAMIIPPKEQYVNVHKNCFHLFEIG